MRALFKRAVPRNHGQANRNVFLDGKRSMSSSGRDRKNANTMYLLGAVTVATVGLSYAAVPLYRMFCTVTGYGGTTQRDDGIAGAEKSSKHDTRPFKITFESLVSDSLPWSFEPLQKEVIVAPGVSTLAFFRAKNNSDKPIVGVSTYNVQPSKAGAYFVKIQCFCFEEQRLAPGEELEMPVFFFVDPDILDDHRLDEEVAPKARLSFLPCCRLVEMKSVKEPDAALKACVLRILSLSEEDAALAKWENLGGSARSLVYRVMVVRGDRSKNVVVKAPVERMTAEWSDREQRLGNEVAALQLLQELLKGPRSITAVMVGFDLRLGVMVLEEIAPIRGRLDALLAGTGVKTQGGSAAAVKKLAIALATVHGAAAGNLGRYKELREATHCRAKAAPGSKESVTLLLEMIESLQCCNVDREGFSRELSVAFEESFSSDGSFATLIHADLCPDNVMLLNKRGDVCILDFEFSRPGNALMDVSFLRLGFPTCWCAFVLPKEAVKDAERAYKENVSDKLPAATDKTKWRMSMAQCCLLWTWGFVRSSIAKGALKADAPMSKNIAGSPSRRQMMLFRLDVTIKALSKVPDMKCALDASQILRAKLATMFDEK